MATWYKNADLRLGLAAILLTHTWLIAADGHGTSGNVSNQVASVEEIGNLNSPSPDVIAATSPNPLLVEPIMAPKPVRAVSVERAAYSRSATRAWIALTISQHSANIFDAWSTRQALGSGRGYERDPLLRPFASSSAIYPATQVVPIAFDFLGYRMMKSQNRYLRRVWWLPQAASIAGSLWCGSRNMHVANPTR